MYSRKIRDDYSDYVITPPPGYDGSRFGSRSDGRDDSFPPYNDQGQIYSQPTKIKENIEKKKCEENKSCSLFPFLKKGIGQEELLLIALLIVLVGEKDISPEIVLILALLLCI